MKHPRISSDIISKQTLQNKHFTILELLDRLLDKGVMVKGEVFLSVADIDLIYLNLGLLLSSVKTVEKAARRGGNGKAELIFWQTATQGKNNLATTPETEDMDINKNGNGEAIARTLPSFIDYGLDQVIKPKTNIDPKNVEKGLIKLVLTLVELIRKLMEKQAVRRMESGFLTAVEVERMGTAFLLLDKKMEQLKKNFALRDEDLNLDLGPLGELM